MCSIKKLYIYTADIKLQKYKIMKSILLLFLMLPFTLIAQLSEDFSDGDFSQNPSWTGTSNLFQVNSALQLQLNATEAGSAWLSTPYAVSGDVEWRFYVRQSFSPSGSNYGKVYLVSNQADLSQSLNGYFLRFGEAGSEDAIELLKQSGTSSESICRGTSGLVASSFALNIKVIRTQDGMWTIYVDADGSGVYQQEATGTDNSYLPGGFLGFVDTYTVSNATKFYYDNIYAGPEIVDNTPPALISANAIDPFTVELQFDEALSGISALNMLNYSADGDLGNPDAIMFGSNSSIVQLIYNASFENGRTYQLTISNLADLAGNIAPAIQTTFSYYEAQANDIVINEIMADPSPIVGLPEWEYVELYNQTAVDIDLNGWIFVAGTSEKPLEGVSIPANGYLVLCHEDGQPAMATYGNAYGFSSFQLTNAGTSLQLLNQNGNLISSVSYTDKWYNDPAKADGGWSIEQIDPANSCGGRNNWTASVDPSGGTPGKLNSVDAPNVAAPAVLRYELASASSLQIFFDQQMDPASLSLVSNYYLEAGNINPAEVTTDPEDPTFVELTFANAFEAGNIYKLIISASVMNCAGLPVADNTFILFGIPDEVEPNDVVINEILFNPLGDGVDYVEIYNRSNKTLDLNQLWLGSVRQTIPNPPDTTLKEITPDSYLFLPQSYALLTTSKSIVLSQYTSENPDAFVEMASFPTYSNDAGTAILKAKTGKLIDEVSYTEDMQYPLLTTAEGVSLERISFDRPSDDPTNWHSAAESVGFGTPAYQNSMLVLSLATDDAISIDPEIFSPDSDGRADVTSIAYAFDEAGYTLNVYIFDGSGQQQRHLVKSMLVGQTGAVSWDGLDENNNKVPIGIYVVFVEAFDLNGKVKSYKKAVVVASK